MTLGELTAKALAQGESMAFFRVRGSDDIYTVHLSRYDNSGSFSAFNNSTDEFVTISGNATVTESAAPTGRGHYGFCDG